MAIMSGQIAPKRGQGDGTGVRPRTLPEAREQSWNHTFWAFVIPYGLLLGLYIARYTSANPDCQHDECEFLMMAGRILEGNMNVSEGFTLHWGPGWPFVIAAAKLFDAGLLLLRLMNVLFVVWALILLRRLLKLSSRGAPATLLTIGVALYPGTIYYSRIALSDPFFLLLILAFWTFYLRYLEKGTVSSLLGSGASLAFAATVKVLCGYVLTALIPVTLLIGVMYRGDAGRVRASYPFLLALCLCVPYLTYTYIQSGKLFYWGSGGGRSYIG